MDEVDQATVGRAARSGRAEPARLAHPDRARRYGISVGSAAHIVDRVPDGRGAIGPDVPIRQDLHYHLEAPTASEFVDRTPLQIYAVLLDRGRSLCSVASMYRVLAEHAQVKDRRPLARHPARVRPELIATGPGEVFTWDITKLRGPVKAPISTPT